MQTPLAVEPDPRPPRSGRVMLVLVGVLVVVTAVLQQAGMSSKPPPPGPAGEKPRIAAPGPEFDLIARTIGKIALSDEQWRSIGAMWIENLDEMARSDADRFRVALFVGEMDGPQSLGEDSKAFSAAAAVRRRLNELEPKLAEDSPLRRHIGIARAIYLGEGEPPDEAALKELAESHGWIGRLAATHGRPDSDPERAKVVGGGTAIVWFLVLASLAGIAALVTGAALLLTAIILGVQGRLPSRVVPPSPGSGLLLEMVALFIVGFLVLKGLSQVAYWAFGEQAAVWFSLGGQWCLLLVLLWPRVRGAPTGEARVNLGLTRGRGVLIEVGAGVIGYVACLPILVCGTLVSVVLMLTYQYVRTHVLGQGPPEPPENRIIDIVAEQRGSWMMVVFFLLASLWAPIAEESIFRGALFGHLRRGWHWLPAGIATALAFGLMHQYPLLLLGGVTSLGFGFCLLREWRGSLIAPMTAHALHNAGVLTLLLVFLGLLGD